MRRARERIGATVGILLGAIVAGASSLPAEASAATTAPPSPITWKGLQWNVKSGAGKNPGLNSWSPANVSVDTDGDLHLSITQVGGTWSCAEVWTDATFGFGAFQWQVRTAVDKLDPNVVLGLFAYGPPALGPDGTHEIDVEYSRFGAATGDDNRWTIFPNVIFSPPLLGRSTTGLLLGADPTTTSRFTWTPTSVAFETLGGFQPAESDASVLNSWTFLPGNPYLTISQAPMPVHMNLWLYHGAPPTDGLGVEVVIHDFSHTASVVANSVPALPGHRAWILAASLLGLGVLALGPRVRARIR